MNLELPVVDDTIVWNAWMSLYNVPAMSVALELDIFEELLSEPASPEELALRKNYEERGLKALLAMLMHLGFLSLHGSRYQLTEAARQYMLKSSPFYWGGVFKRVGRMIVPHKLLLEAVTQNRTRAGKDRPAEGWESGEVDMDMAKEVTSFMHSHSMAAAVGMTKTCDFGGVRKVLDIGGGSGCFSIALAKMDPDIRCTVMELPAICELADEYIADAGVSEQVDTRVVDMFRAGWPPGYDMHFFSNIFHDWSFDTCRKLARNSFEALTAGGRIVLHEMLLEDSGTSPYPAVAFSVLMTIGTFGQQFTFPQLQDILASAGFTNIRCRNSYGYYSIVTGDKE